MLKFQQLFQKSRCSVIGMIHVDALPGSPRFKGSIEKIIKKACNEAEIYLKNGIDGIMVENMHDIPYIQSKHFGPEVIASMTRICSYIRNLVPNSIPCGLQVLAGGNTESIAIAKVCSFQFIRAEGFVFSHVADEGFTDANAGNLLRYRKNLEAEDILILADIKKKHSAHAITADVSLVETAEAAEFFLADGVILTGNATGDPANKKELETLKKSVNIPVLIGSGVTIQNLEDYIKADALIIGSHFKEDGKWNSILNGERINNFMKKIEDLK